MCYLTGWRPSRWFWLRLILLIVSIGGYYGYNSAYTKALPALVLIPFAPHSSVQAGLLLASFGDYFLYLADHTSQGKHSLEFQIPGILSFGGFHLLLISRTLIYKIYDHLGTKRYLLGLWIVLFGIATFISKLVPIPLIVPVFLYGQILSLLLISSISITAIEYRISKLIDTMTDWKNLNPHLHYPRVFLIGAIMFIISDLFVFSQIVNINLSYFEYIGLPLYWLSLFVLVQAFIQEHPHSYDPISIN